MRYRGSIFREDYHKVNDFGKLLESPLKFTKFFELNRLDFTEKQLLDTIEGIKVLLYSSFKDIQKGDYDNLGLRFRSLEDLPAPFSLISNNLKDSIYSILNSYLKAYHATIPTDLINDKYDLRNIETDRKALEELVKLFSSRKKLKRIGVDWCVEDR